MKLKVVTGIVLALFLASMLKLAFTVQPVKASGTIYIRANGSVEPQTANITSVDNVTYTFTDNNYDEIVVERSNIIIDGNGYMLQGSGSGKGFSLSSVNNVTIQNTNIKNFGIGLYLSSSSNNTVSGNTVTNNTYYGVYLYSSSNNNIVYGNNITNNIYGIHLLGPSNNHISANNVRNNDIGIDIWRSSNNHVSVNNITNNGAGIELQESSNNSISGNTITANNSTGILILVSSDNIIFNNNLVNNIRQVHSLYSTNVWDAGYPSGGNYWSDYTGVDLFSGPYQNETVKLDSDGIGDTPYIIDENNTDNHPLMGMFSDFPISSIGGYKLEKIFHVTTISNSTITNFMLSPLIWIETGEWIGGEVFLYVDGPAGTKGFIRFTIPKDLLDSPEGLEAWTVYLNGTDVTLSCNIWENSTHTFIYVPYNHSTQEIMVMGTWIVPEFPTWTSILLILIVLTVAIAIYKRRLLKTPIQ